MFRLFDQLESVEMHNNVIVTNGTGGPNVMRANAGEFMWVNGTNIAGSNNWVMTGATNIPTQWTGTITGASPGLINLTSDPRPITGSPVDRRRQRDARRAGRVRVPEPALAARLSPAAALADSGGQRDGAAVRRNDRHRRLRARRDDGRHGRRRRRAAARAARRAGRRGRHERRRRDDGGRRWHGRHWRRDGGHRWQGRRDGGHGRDDGRRRWQGRHWR